MDEGLIGTMDGHDNISTNNLLTLLFFSGKYYNIWTDYSDMSAHILWADVDSTKDGNETKINDIQTESLFHALTCDPHSSGHTLLGVASDSGSDFMLKRLELDTVNETVIGQFPEKEVVWGGSDSIFAFNADGSEVWAAWPADHCPDCSGSKKGGRVHVMDTATGTIKQTLKVKNHLLGANGSPYFLIPDQKRGVFDYGNLELKWIDFEIENGEFTYKTTGDASALWASSMPPKVCNDGNTVLTLPFANAETSTLSAFTISDGTSTASIDLTQTFNPKDGPHFGGIACLTA